MNTMYYQTHMINDFIAAEMSHDWHEKKLTGQ